MLLSDASVISNLSDCNLGKLLLMGLQSLKGVIGVCQLKGGVGASTLTAALGACWARHGRRAAIVDLDDINPHLTEWAKVPLSYRAALSAALREGSSRSLKEMSFPVPGYDGKLVLIGQPDTYQESFHFKADVIAGAPSISDFIPALIRSLTHEFDVVLLDLSRSWGMATFASLPLCQHVMLVMDDDPVSVSRSLAALKRIKRETDDPGEFDFRRWCLTLNGYTNRLISRKQLATEVRRNGLIPETAHRFIVPFSERGRDWGAPGQSFYDTADLKTRGVLELMAKTLVPFPAAPAKKERKRTVLGRLRSGLAKA